MGAGFFWYTEGNSRYNALQTDVVRRLSKGLQFRFNYTWSKNLDMNSGLTGAQSNNQAQMIMDRNDLSRDWGPSALNVAHQASISAHYELPFGKGKHGSLRESHHRRMAAQRHHHAVERLPLHAAVRLQPLGRRRHPQSRPAFRQSARSQDQSSPATRISGSIPPPSSLPPPGTWGNVGRGVYYGPGLANLDLSLFKNTAITERISLQFRAEAFNLLNHANYGTPNATVFTGTTIDPVTKLTVPAVNPSAGLITSTATFSRQIQLGLKLIF